MNNYKKVFLVFLLLANGSVSSHAARMDNNGSNLPIINTSQEDPNYTQTKYPIVLAHGLFGFDKLFNRINYFFDIPYNLRRSGAEVFFTQVSAANSTEVRGEELLAQIEKILEKTGAEKVNIVGHSHGAGSARYVAALRPQWVASVTSVGGANQGNSLADFFLRIANNKLIGPVFSLFVNGFSKVIDIISGGGFSQNINKALIALSSEGMDEFNKKFPAGVPVSGCGNGKFNENGILYFSWSGGSPKTNAADVLDYITLFDGSEKSSDGIVSACGSHLGYIIRDDYHMNHFDQVNHTIGIHGVGVGSDPIAVWRAHANRLKRLGL